MGPRGVRGGGEGEWDATKAYLIPGLCPPRQLGEAKDRPPGLHPHAVVGHPGPEPALPVDAVLSPVLEAT